MMNYTRVKGTAELEERTMKNAEDFLDRAYTRDDEECEEEWEDEE